jgi:thymidylate synthase (FAD)
VLDREFYIPDKDLLKLVKATRKEEPVQERLFDLPGAEHTAAQSATNKQGRDEVLGVESAAGILREIGGISSRSFTVYEKLLGDEERPGIARELARMVLPLNTYTQWYWKVDLHNLLHFLRLRHDSHAQYEIRAYAEVLLDIVRKWVPLTAAAFEEYRVGGAELSAAALAVIRRRLAGEAISRETSGLSAGEWRELETLLPGIAGG